MRGDTPDTRGIVEVLIIIVIIIVVLEKRVCKEAVFNFCAKTLRFAAGEPIANLDQLAQHGGGVGAAW